MSAISGIRDRGGWVSAVIVDTLNATLHGEENSAAVIQEYVRAIAPICGELGAAFVVTHHIRKQGKEPIRDLDDMNEASRGSTALQAAVRMVLGFGHATDDPRAGTSVVESMSVSVRVDLGGFRVMNSKNRDRPATARITIT